MTERKMGMIILILIGIFLSVIFRPDSKLHRQLMAEATTGYSNSSVGQASKTSVTNSEGGVGSSASRSTTMTNLDRYTVKKGDSLFSISRRYKVSVKDLQEANSLSSPLIVSGQTLLIPPSTNGARRHTVQKGESLYLISRKYGLTVEILKESNGLKSDEILVGELLSIPREAPSRKTPTGEKRLEEILKEKRIGSGANLSILVDKSEHTVSILANGTWLKTYHAEFGDGGAGDKKVAGDHRTPEGTFYITQKSILHPTDEYLGSRWLRLSYPNIENATRGLRQGLIDWPTYHEIVAAINKGTTPPQYTKLGGGIGIHGGDKPSFGPDWTWGCVGLSDKDVEDFYDHVTVGAKVVIRK